MSNRNKTNTDNRSTDDQETRHKGEGQQSQQKGAESVSHKKTSKHRKDESEGADRNTTKKQSNSI
jgi:hypothetical protein